MANNITISDKNTGDSHTASEYNTVKAWLNEPLQALSDFTSDFVFDGTKECNDYTLSANETWNFSNIKKGNYVVFELTTNGSYTVTAGTGVNKDFSNFFGQQLPSGTYQINLRSTSKGIDIVVPELNVSAPTVAWTSFNGTTNHLYFGDILSSYIHGADKKFRFSVEVRNWDNSSELQRLLTLAGPSTDAQRQTFTAYIDLSGLMQFTYYDGVSGGDNNVDRIQCNTALTTVATKITIEYDGSIDTAAEDRVTFYIDDVAQTGNTNPSGAGTFPWDMTHEVTQEMAFGRYRYTDGTFATNNFNGDARNLQFDSWNGSSYDTVLNVPELSTGIDTSGSGLNGTWV